jgi:hypothetical protein
MFWKSIDPKESPYLNSIMLNEAQRELVEPFIPHLIEKLQNRGVKTIALMHSRMGKFGIIEDMAEWRIRVLKQFGIDFSLSSPEKEVIYFDEGKRERYSLFKDGVLFLGNNETYEGTLLVQFLEKIKWKPKKIVFIDSAVSNLASVEFSLYEAGIPFQGYRHKRIHKLPCEIDKQIVEIQLESLRKDHRWLSDSAAKER